MAKIKKLPLWLRKFISDVISGFIPAIIVLPLIGAHEAFANSAFLALAFAVSKAASRNVGAFLQWVDGILGTNDES
jgi:hypothetical protein